MYHKEELSRRYQEELERKEEERIKEEIRKDEEVLQKRYQQEEQIRKFRATNSILSRLGINDKNSWRKWIIVNHPDKGGKNEYYPLVMEEGRRIGY